jgi:hypothetical protein
MVTRITIAVFALFALALLSPLHKVHAQTTAAQTNITNIIGTWKATIPGRRKGLVFRGELLVRAGTGPNQYRGRLTLNYPEGKKSVVQDANISVEGSKVTIKCTVAKLIGFGPGESYNADEYLLTLAGNTMSGGSQDMSGYADENNVFQKM